MTGVRDAGNLSLMQDVCAVLRNELRLGVPSGTRCELSPNLFRQHEAHVFLDDIELFDVVCSAFAEPVDKSLDKLFRRTGTRSNTHNALAFKPFFAHL